MIQKVKIMYYKNKFHKKPDNEVIAIVSTELVEKAEMDIRDLANNVANGSSFKCSYLDGTKTKDWISSQLFGIDIDNTDEDIQMYGYLSINDFIKLCERYNIMPLFMYKTLRSTNEREKFRAIFGTETEITDYRLQRLIQLTLMKIFPPCDKSCKDVTRLFLGGKELIYENYENTISPLLIMNTYLDILKEKDSKSFSRNAKKHCKELGLNMINGYPDMKLCHEKSAEPPLEPSIYYSGNGQCAPLEMFNFSVSSSKSKNTELDCENLDKESTIYIINEVKEAYILKDNFNFQKLEVNCRLYREFINGENWIDHNKYFGLATNLCRYEGGAKRLIAALDHYNYSDFEKINKVNTAKTVYSKYNYSPFRCDTFCPYHTECSNTGDNIASMELYKGEIRKIHEPKYEDLITVRSRTKEAIEFATCEKNSSRITIIKSPTAIGKSELYLDYVCTHNNIGIAVPTHILGENIYQRYRSKTGNKNDIIKTYKLDEKYPCTKKYNRLMKVGLFNEAKAQLSKFICNSSNTTKEYLENAVSVLNNMDKVTSADKIIVTHAGMLHLDNANIKTFFIDEDIFNTIVKTVDCSLRDLSDIIFTNFDSQTEKALIKFKEEIEKADMNKVCETPTFERDYHGLDEVIHDCQSTLTTNIYDCIESRYFIKYRDHDNIRITMIKTDFGNMFLYNIKYIILSATADELICKKMFGEENVNFIDCGYVKPQGKIYLHSKFTASRNCLNNEENQEEKLKYIESKTNKNYPTYTFKTSEEVFKNRGFNIFGHFGSSTGIDSLRGEKINVIGTPHLSPYVYALYAKVLDIKIFTDDPNGLGRMAFRTVKRNGYEFKFYTYIDDNTQMQNLQFYLIESELLQAVGRARANIEDSAEVHIFSNLPVPFCELAIDCNETDYEDSPIKEMPDNNKEVA